MTPKTARPRPPDEVKMIQVIEVKSLVGFGTSEDICRIATSYWSPDGKFLAIFDPENPPPFVSVDGRGEVSFEPGQQTYPCIP